MSDQRSSANQASGKYNIAIDNARGLTIGDYAQPISVYGDIYIFHPQELPKALQSISHAELLKALEAANQELRLYQHTIAGIPLERVETLEIVEWVKNAEPDQKLGLLLDQSGGGKTVIMRSVLECLEKAGIPALSIKADTLSNVKDHDQLAQWLHLPASVVECARVFADRGLFVVVLDQLDALSLQLSRDQATLDLMLNTLAALRGIKNVRIIASCRTFDLHYDPRLSKLKEDRTFYLQPLSEEQIKSVLNRIEINYNQLLPAHQKLLSIPLQLELYTRIVAGRADGQSPESFRTLQELYEGLWQRHIALAPESASCVKAIYKLVEAMQSRQRLTAPESILDDNPNVAIYLQRIGFIRHENNNFLFAHQTLFDYCYARHFVGAGHSISQVVLTGPQGLFERSQMVQVLAYLRGADESCYQQELSELLFSDQLRFHMRALLLNWFGSLRSPTRHEKALALRLISTTEGRNRFLMSASGNADWFYALGSDTLRRIIMETDERTEQTVCRYLGELMPQCADHIVPLLSPFVGKGESWANRVILTLTRLQEWKYESVVDLLCDAIGARPQVDVRNWDVDLCIHNLAASNPAAGCRVVRALLDHKISFLPTEEEKREKESKDEKQHDKDSVEKYLRSKAWRDYLFINDHSLNDLLDRALKVSPEAIIEYLFPWFVETCRQLTFDQSTDSYPNNYLFDTRWYGDYISDAAAFARRMAEALGRIAVQGPTKFRALARELQGVESYAVQHVLVYGYCANPRLFANEAADYLLADERRLALGNENYDSVRLVAAIFGFLSSERRGALETMILNQAPQWEKRGKGLNGFSQLPFLKSIPVDLLSQAAQRRLGELERRFADYEFAPPKGIEVRDIAPPPIPASALAKMSDDDWLNAIKKYKESYQPGRSGFTGGLDGMASAFSDEARKYPERFYRLSFRFDEEIPFKYVQFLISVLSVTQQAPAEWVFDVIRRFAHWIAPVNRRDIIWALEKRSKENVPDDLLDLVTEWALTDPDPGEERWQEDNYGNNHYHAEPYNQGINCNRGAGIQTVSLCRMWKDVPQTDRVLELLEKAVADPSTAVRSVIVECLNWTLHHGQDERTLQLFEQVMNGHPRLLQSPPTHKFLHRCTRHHFFRIRPFIEQMLADTDHNNTRQNGAALACLAAFDHSEAEELVRRVLSGDAVMRRGAAQVYARNLAHPALSQSCRELCRERLTFLMHDPDENVRSSVGNCFEYLKNSDFYSVQDFVRAYAFSPALAVSSRKYIVYLLDIVEHEHKLPLEAAERYLGIEESKRKVGERSRLDGAEGDELTRLILNVYTHTLDGITKSRSLELFERLLVAGSLYAHNALSDWDRR